MLDREREAALDFCLDRQKIFRTNQYSGARNVLRFSAEPRQIPNATEPYADSKGKSLGPQRATLLELATESKARAQFCNSCGLEHINENK